jgi:hypothetical protein
MGTGLAVLDRWDFYPERLMGEKLTHRAPETFRRLTRDLYIAGGDNGFWQGAFRDPSDPAFAAATAAINAHEAMTIDLLYGDHDGGQRAVTRIALLPKDDGRWIASAARHWNLDRANPR